jgi:hypothetical protein
MGKYQKFISQYLLLTCFFIAVIIIFNWMINPYNIYNTIKINKVLNKPLVASHLRLAKAVAVEWKKPLNLILGSSTAETGIDPDYTAWGKDKAYNLGLSGANIYEVMRYLQHAEAIYPAKKVILVVNFFMFNIYSKNREDFDETILRVKENGKKNLLVTNTFFSTLLSYDALKASVYTIVNQNQKNAFKSNGQLIWDYRVEQVMKLGGYKNNFLHAEKYNRETLLPSPKNKYDFFDPLLNVSTIEYLQKIIKLCEAKNTDLQIVIAPEHIRLLETYKLLGLWKKYEQWQIELTRLVEKHNRAFPLSPYYLRSFNRITPCIKEPFPAKNDKSLTMKWFWDPMHFKNELGNLMLQQILSPQRNENRWVNLNSQNIQREFLRNKSELRGWEIKNQPEVKELKSNLFRSSG